MYIFHEMMRFVDRFGDLYLVDRIETEYGVFYEMFRKSETYAYMICAEKYVEHLFRKMRIYFTSSIPVYDETSIRAMQIAIRPYTVF